ncbi:glycosyltransferase family 2 protein [Clostridium tyrobutyricum]|uniref:glycosyltransferase family 2 protein n=1 Tax=Clostridium tyrobutyricum TaxID=1519 RepID=UPI001C37ED81|nr:glycosyltransferase family 2 protein [Clostridium tyrobutyricum]MBV4421995.1 glycosyltransferase [Clostridium tyrobutyricum]
MLSLCMIVKNEEKILDRCLLSVKDYSDEIIIVDTGSSDKTKDIAYKYTDKVFDYDWCNDFSKARNFSISKAENDWILVLDADEIVNEFDKESILEFCSNRENLSKVGRIKRINEYEDVYGKRKYIERINRLFNKNIFYYSGTIHEQVVHNNGIDYQVSIVGITIDHTGYSKEVLKKTKKIERNIIMLKEALKINQNNPYINYQLGKSLFLAKDYSNAIVSFTRAIQFVDNFNYEYSEDLIESLGYALLNLNKFDKAMKIEEYSNYYSNSPDYLFLLALVYMNNGKFQKAAETFLYCTEFKDGKIEGITSYLPFYNIGVIFECLGLKKEAVGYYSMCGDYKPAKKRISNIII